jgi:hypothetical protein
MLFLKGMPMCVNMVLDSSNEKSVKAYVLNLASLVGGGTGDPGLILDAAEKFFRFIWFSQLERLCEPQISALPLPCLEPEVHSFEVAQQFG